MQNGLRSPRLNDASKSIQAPVINIQTHNKGNSAPTEKLVAQQPGKKLPLFYTDPIFKAKKHDFL